MSSVASSSSGSSRLCLPARKCLSQDLSDARALDNSTSIAGLHVWRLRAGIAVSVAWMQGTVRTVSDDGDVFTLDDGTGHVIVKGATNVPARCPKPQPGKYMLVVGELMETSPQPELKVMKVQDLSHDIMAPAFWNLEVQDLQLNVR